MAAKFPLQLLLELAGDHADKAAKELLELKARWHAAEEKLRQLQSYRTVYRDKMQRSTEGGMSVAMMRDFQLFMAKLDQAIRLQEEEVARCQARWEKGQQKWLEQKRKHKAFDALSVRHRHKEAQKEERREQKDQDEYARRFADRKDSDKD